MDEDDLYIIYIYDFELFMVFKLIVASVGGLVKYSRNDLSIVRIFFP